MEKVSILLRGLSPKTEQEELFGLCCLVLECVNSEDVECLYYLSRNYYQSRVSEGWGFANSYNGFNPSIVEFGEFSEFAHDFVIGIKNGSVSKQEAMKNLLKYFEEYILPK